MTYPRSDPRWKPTHRGKALRSGPHTSAFKKGLFCAWDGEGITDPDTQVHRYTLLMNSEGGKIENWADGLSTRQCLEFMVSEARRMDQRTIHVFYSHSYDVNMLCRDIDRERIRMLHAGRRTAWRNWILTYRTRKEFAIQPLWPTRQRQVTFWDVVGFFQSKFTEAIAAYFPELGTEHIAKMKARRKTFTADDRVEITAYCQEEVQLLKLLMERLREYLEKANLSLARWDGAGAVAASVFRREKLEDRLVYNEEIERWAAAAYAGGRIECLRYGMRRGPVWVYDVNSGYPAALMTIPDIKGGHWREVTEYEANTYSIWQVEWDWQAGHSLYPFFFRLHNDCIRYPHRGAGWYWGVEVDAALRQRVGTTRIKKGFVLDPGDGLKPFSFVAELYAQRKAWKAAKEPAEKVLKLGINSMYGKTVQQVGWKVGNESRRPPFHSMVCGSYVTAWTRAKLYSAANHDIDRVVFLATDGICASGPLSLPTGSDCGNWSETIYPSGVLSVQSGVYWYYGDSGPIVTHYRGYDEGQLDPNMILEGWRKGEPFIRANSTRFVQMGTALTGDERWKKWRTWDTIERKLALRMEGKRIDLSGRNPADGLILTTPTPVKGNTWSKPYPLAWLGAPLSAEIEGVTNEVYIQEYEDSYD